MARLDDVGEVIKSLPGLTESEIAERLFGRKGQQQRVNPICRRLVEEGRVERRGRGYAQDPYTYRWLG